MAAMTEEALVQTLSGLGRDGIDGHRRRLGQTESGFPYVQKHTVIMAPEAIKSALISDGYIPVNGSSFLRFPTNVGGKSFRAHIIFHNGQHGLLSGTFPIHQRKPFIRIRSKAIDLGEIEDYNPYRRRVEVEGDSFYYNSSYEKVDFAILVPKSKTIDDFKSAHSSQNISQDRKHLSYDGKKRSFLINCGTHNEEVTGKILLNKIAPQEYNELSQSILILADDGRTLIVSPAELLAFTQ
jgi:hypothetical protein